MTTMNEIDPNFPRMGDPVPDWRHELRAHFSLEHGACYWIGNVKVSKERWDAAMEIRASLSQRGVEP